MESECGVGGLGVGGGGGGGWVVEVVWPEQPLKYLLTFLLLFSWFKEYKN